MLPSWLLSRTLAVYWQVMWCAKLLKQMLALTHGTTLQRLPEEAASEQRERPMSLFPLKWFCMVLLACVPAIVANCTKLRYPYIYIYTRIHLCTMYLFICIQYLCNITYLYVFIYVEITNVDSWWFAFRCKEAFVRSCFCWPFSAQEPAWQPSSRTCIEVTIDFDPLHLRLILESWKLQFCRNLF